MPRTKTNYSFDVKHLGEMTAEANACPLCGSDLTKNDAITVSSQTVNRGKPFKTKIGNQEPYVGYVMDGNMDDATLILADDYPDVRCSECGEALQQNEHAE